MKVLYILIIILVLIGGFMLIKNPSKTSPELSEDLAKAVFAGGCFWCMEADFDKLNGVKDVVSGYSGGQESNANYEEVSAGTTGHKEVVQVTYDPKEITYEELLETFWVNVDPFDEKGQFCDKGSSYLSAIFYSNEQEKKAAAESKEKVKELFREEVATEVIKFDAFYEAEEYHQDYHEKSSIKYKSYRFFCGRDTRLKELWNDKTFTLTSNFQKPSDSELKKTLTPLQYKITQQDGTESPFDNEYNDNKEEGIYVDLISGEALFSSTDKYDSKSGWPSFTKPLESKNIVEKEDNTLFTKRTEIRSKLGDNHIGHVFPDGPQPLGLRYCMNSAGMKFIPKKDMKKLGYEEYLHLFS